MTAVVWEDRNPFTDQYVREEVEFYGLLDYDSKGVVISSGSPVGRLDDYLNKGFATGALTVPVLRIDGRLWMSLTRMECQSQHLAIQFATGAVGTIGLGMGHFVLRAMAKQDVDSITVFESDPRVMHFFKACFHGRPGFWKLRFVLGDGREKCRDYAFDYLYVDCYPTLCPDGVADDIELFTMNNDLANGTDSYHFWGLERVYLDAIMLGLIYPMFVDTPILEYLATWQETRVEGMEDYTLGGLHQPLVDEEYALRVLSVMGVV